MASNDMYLPFGCVGIGTAAPTTSLEIQHATNPKIFLNYNNGTSAYFLSGTGSSLDFGNYVGGALPIRFMPNNTEVMRISGSGNVGIGTTSPSAKLDVRGGAIGADGINAILRVGHAVQSTDVSIAGQSFTDLTGATLTFTLQRSMN